tara:strand:+ start:409 stop:663 length:255 start_codon:yes stop_codon:yes gene_type:complete
MDGYTEEQQKLQKQIDAIDRSIGQLCKDADTRDKIRTLRLFHQNINTMMFSMLSRAEMDLELQESDQNRKIAEKYEALKKIFED